MKAWKPPPGFIPPITVDDVRTKRSVGNLVAWYKDVRDTIFEDRDTTRWYRHRADDAAKAFAEEVIPLGLMLDHETDIPRDAGVVVPCNNEADDALLLTCRPDGTDQRIQITTDWSYQEALRMEYLTKGVGISVNAFGPMTRDKETRNPQRSPLRFSRQEKVWHDCAQRAIELIQNKNNKAYVAGTWLVVEIHDPATRSDRDDLREFVCEKLRPKCSDSQFERIYIVSPNGEGFCRRIRG